MLCVALFDREINCRRAASAAFQENVGRQGHANFPNGIEILTAADFFTLGNRNNAFLTIACEVAKYPRYRYMLIDHLWTKKLSHWDAEIRTLASKSLSALTFLDPSYMESVVLSNILPSCLSTDLFKRHGCTLGVAELLVSLSKYPYGIQPETLKTISSLVERIEKARLYRGRGGEIMRLAVCKLISGMAESDLKIPISKQLKLLGSLDENLCQPNENIQTAAIIALKMFLSTYFPVNEDKGPSEKLQSRTIHQYANQLLTSENVAVTRGSAGALGALPRCQLATVTENGRAGLQTALDALITASHRKFKVGPEPDVETRQKCLESIVQLCETVGYGRKGGLEETQVASVYTCLLEACSDYSMDKRGDVGSWCRISALKGMKRLTRLLLKPVTSDKIDNSFSIDTGSEVVCQFYGAGKVKRLLPNGKHCLVEFIKPAFGYYYFSPNAIGILDKHTLCKSKHLLNEKSEGALSTPEHRTIETSAFNQEVCLQIMNSILKQLSEKLDAVRTVAGSCLEWFLTAVPSVPYILRRDSLKSVLQSTYLLGGSQDINWAVPSHTFPLVIQLLSVECYHYAILSGLVVSIGGLTESVVKSSSAVFLEWVDSMTRGNVLAPICMLADSLLQLFDDHRHDDRVICPLLKSLDFFLSNEIFDSISEKRNDFALNLFPKLKVELQKCQNVSKILTIGNIIVGMMHFMDASKTQSLQMLLLLLGHRFPKVRKGIAEQLYIKLIAFEGIIDGNTQEQVLELIIAGQWEGDQMEAYAQRNAIANALQIELCLKDTSAKKYNQRLQNPKGSTFDSYESLVREVGY